MEVPDLESIIRDFERGFRSPSKKGAARTGEIPKQHTKNFVKQIVEAFEVKYKTYELQVAEVAKEAEKANKRTEIVAETKQKSCLLSSPIRSGSEEFRNVKRRDTPKRSAENSSKRRGVIFATPPKYSAEDSMAFRRSGVYGSPFKFSDDEDCDQEHPANESKDAKVGSTPSTPSKRNSEGTRSNGKWSAIFSPFNSSKESARSDIYTSPVHLECQNSKDSGSDGCSFDGFDKEEPGNGTNVPFNPPRVSSLDDTITLESIDTLDMTLPEPDETIFLDELENHALRKTSTAIGDYDRSNEEDSLIDPPAVFRSDKTPKIIGAFLKKPISVEDTSIDWIPITGKKLPRKKSLKKLLTSWATKRSFDKKNALFSSERNLTEETRELQDSGYDEKSSSSSSSTSLISITEALLQQENSYIEPHRRSSYKTFRPRSLDALDDAAFEDVRRDASKQPEKKLVLTEVPREQVKVDLGPAYPIPKVVVTMSLERKTPVAKKPATSPGEMKPLLPRLPKHPHLSSIPKHPFVALTKLDQPEYANNEPVVIKNKLYEVEFRRSCTNIDTSNTFRNSSSSSLESNYDVPRRFLSKSETQIPDACEAVFSKPREPIYDTPRRRHQERPRSSVYEDTISTKRKNKECIGQQQSFSQYYSSPPDTEPHYATVKPIYNRPYHSREVLPSSVDDIASVRNAYAF